MKENMVQMLITGNKVESKREAESRRRKAYVRLKNYSTIRLTDSLTNTKINT